METKQPEGLKLMRYATRDGSEDEVIWNSRDAVTPFIVRSRTGKEMLHVAWRSDVSAPHFVPRVGDRVFVDLTMERALESRRAFVARCWNDPQYPAREHAREMDGAEGKSDEELRELFALMLAKGDLESFPPHTPDLVEVTHELQVVFAARAEKAGAPSVPQDPWVAYRSAEIDAGMIRPRYRGPLRFA